MLSPEQICAQIIQQGTQCQPWSKFVPWWPMPCGWDLGRLLVNSCSPQGSWRVLMWRHHCTMDLDKGLGWGWLGYCLLFLPLTAFLRSFISLSRTYNGPFSLVSATCLTQSEASCCHDCRLIPICASRHSSAGFCNNTILLSLGAQWKRLLWVCVCPCNMASPVQLNLTQDVLYAEQMSSLEDIVWCSCHLTPRMKHKQFWWKC